MKVDFDYAIDTKRGFDEVVAAVEKLSAERNFRVLHVHNVQQTLAEKGFQREPLKIIEICNGKFAHEALRKTMDTSLFMPCKINVYTEDGQTKIKAMRPAAISQMLPGTGLDELAAEVDKIVLEIVDIAAGKKQEG